MMTLRLTGIEKEFMQGSAVIPILRGISAEFQQGSTYAIMGVSGTGKSTLLSILGGLEAPTRGSVNFNNEKVHAFDAARRQKFFLRDVGYVFQSPHLLPELSVFENIVIKGKIAGMSEAICTERAMDLLERVNLTALAHRAPAALSGGEQQRVALVRAIFLKPAFLLADEPTAHLDDHTRASVVDVMLGLAAHDGAGLIVCTHDRALAARMEHNYALADGRLVG